LAKLEAKVEWQFFLPGTVYISLRYICMSKNRLTVSSRGVMSQNDNTGIPSQFTKITSELQQPKLKMSSTSHKSRHRFTDKCGTNRSHIAQTKTSICSSQNRKIIIPLSVYLIKYVCRIGSYSIRYSIH